MKIFSLIAVVLSTSLVAYNQVNWTVKNLQPSVFVENQGQFDNTQQGEVLFGTQIGCVKFYFTKAGYQAIYDVRYPREEERERFEDIEHGETVKPRERRKWVVNFAGGNGDVEITGESKQSFTYNYGKGDGSTTTIASTYKKIKYSNIYPNIDIEFLLNEKHDLKYNIILRPGANPHDLSIQFPEDAQLLKKSDNEISINNSYFNFNELIPASYEQDSKTEVAVSYLIEENKIGFQLEDYNQKNATVIIDPWIVVASPFASLPDFYKVDYDDAGNVWSIGEHGDQIAKYDNTGSLLWVYNYVGTYSGLGMHGDFVSRHGTGETIFTPNIAGDVIKISPAGTETATFSSTGVATEIWRVEYDEINDQVILGKGGGFWGPYYMGQLSSDFSTEIETAVLPFAGAGVEDIAMTEIDPDGSKVYSISAGDGTTTGYGNHVVTSSLPAFSSPSAFVTYHPFQEAHNALYADYAGSFIGPNSYNGIAVDANYIYTYDGNQLKKYDKLTETLVDSVLRGETPLSHAGIAVDPCGSVYIGTSDSVVIYDASLSCTGGFSMPGVVIDVRVNSGLLYACGEGFLTEVDVSGVMMSPTLSATDESCGACDGTATTDTTVCPGYLFSSILWEPSGQTTLTATDLCGGWQIATIKFVNGSDTLTFVDSVEVMSIGGSIACDESFTNETCDGASDGTITLTATSGTSPWTYDIGTASNLTGVFTDLPPATYAITVTDDSGCEYTSSITIDAGPALTVTTGHTDETCDGSDDGTITLNATSGTSPWNYDIGTASNSTGDFSSLSPATYDITVTDDNGCEFTTTITIDPGIVLAVTIIVTDESCSGAGDGSITLTPTSGSSPYNFDIGTASNTTGSFTGLSNGTYTITVTDDNGCNFNGTANISSVGGLDLSVISQNDPSCYGFTDGSITVAASGGTTPYNYSWSPVNPVPGATFNNLGGGSFTAYVVDDNGCSDSIVVLLIEPDSLYADLLITPPLCQGDQTGIVVIDSTYNAQGDLTNITYIWNPDPPGISGVGADSCYNMGAGIYSLVINDDNGCDNEINFTITEPDELIFSEIGYDPAYCRLFSYQSGNGVVYAAAGGGTPDYTYIWTNLQDSATTVNTTWGGLNPGDYSILVTDDNGCTLTQTITVDSLNPVAAFTAISPQLDENYEGTEIVEISFTNQSENFANPNNPFADTTFFWNLDFDNVSWYISHNYDEVLDTTYSGEQIYEICLVAVNKNGCSDTTCKNIIVHANPVLIAPNVFTPDGNGINDEFTFQYLSTAIQEFHCVIVDRWGIRTAEINNIADGWDGSDFSGSKCTDGVYFFTYKAVSTNGTSFTGQGTVQLLRGK